MASTSRSMDQSPRRLSVHHNMTGHVAFSSLTAAGATYIPRLDDSAHIQEIPPTAPDVRRGRHRKLNSKWPGPGGGGGGGGGSSARCVTQASRIGNTCAELQTQRPRQKTSPRRKLSPRMRLDLKAISRQNLDPVLSEDSVGALVANSATSRDKFSDSVDIGTSVRQAYESLPPLTWRSGPSQLEAQKEAQRLRAYESQMNGDATSDNSSQDGAIIAPKDWNKRTVLDHYRSVARDRVDHIKARRLRKMEETIDTMKAAAGIGDEWQRRVDESKSRPISGKTRPTSATSVMTGKSLRMLKPRLGELVDFSNSPEAMDPSLQYLQVKRSAGWDNKTIQTELQEHGLLTYRESPMGPPLATPAETGDAGQDSGGGGSEAEGQAEVPAPVPPHGESSAASGDDMVEEGGALVLPAIEWAAGGGHAVEEHLHDDSEDKNAWRGQPTLWANASNHPASSSIFEQRGRRVRVSRLHPLLLLKCTAVGRKVLSTAMARAVTAIEANDTSDALSFRMANSGPSTRPSPSKVVTAGLDDSPLGLRANGFEDLLLLEVKQSVAGWHLGPMEKGLFEREIDAENDRTGLPPGALRTRLSRVRTLPQLCLRVALVETLPGMRRLSRNISRVDMTRPARLYSVKSNISEQCHDDATAGLVGRTQAVSFLPESNPAQADPPPGFLGRSASTEIKPHDAVTSDGAEESDPHPHKSAVSFSSAVHEKHATRETAVQKRELTLNLAHSVLTAYDIPGILHILEWRGRQIFECATTAVNISDRARDPNLKEVLKKEGKIAARLLDTSWPVLVHSSDSGMQDTVSYHSILSHAVESLSSTALKSLTITRLILTNTEIGDDGVASLVLGLRGLPALKALDLSDNAGMTWRSCVPLAELVDTGHRNDFRYPKHAVIGCGVCCLQTLVLNGLPIGARGIELLAPRLHRNKSLKTLSLQRTGLKRQSANALSLMLQENIGLQELRLGWNQISAGSAAVMAQALSYNRTLLRFELANTGLGEAGGSHFALTLKENVALQEFDLSNNGIGARTCLVLGEALRCNKSLRVLILDHNPLGEEGGMHLMSALTHNHGLTRLGLHNVSFVDVAEVDDRGYRRMLFNRAKPNGKYTLDLSNPTDRQIATELVRLRAESGAASWRDVRLRGKPFSGPAERDGWPERMPETGRLELRYDTEAVPLLHPESIPGHTLQVIMQELTHPEAVDFWRLGLIKTAASVCFFTVEQAVSTLQTFQWSEEKIEAAIVLFVRVVDTENLEELTATMSSDQHRDLFARLGMAAYLRSENPTGRYYLNLSRQLERVVAQRLLLLAQGERHWRSSRAYVNFRNVVLDGQPVHIYDPTSFVVPFTGFMQFDFIVYDRGTVFSASSGTALLARRRPRPIDGLNFLRLLGAVQSVKELEAVLEAKARGVASGEDTVPDDTPRSSGPRLMRAVRTVMATQARGSGRNIFDLLAQSGLTLREMIESAEETQDAHKDPAQTLDGTTRVQQNHMKDIIRKVDEEVERMAETLTQEEAQPSQPQQPASRRPSIQGSRSSSLKGGDAAATASTSYDASFKAAPPATPPTPRGRKGLRTALGRINALNMMHHGMAKMFDLSIPNVTPLAVVRTFANSHFCTCQQVLQLLCVFDSNIREETRVRVGLVQVLFTRITNLEAIGDVLRACTPGEQLQVMRRVGFLNCVHAHRDDFFNLHGVCFVIRMSVEEEYRVAKILAEFVETLPKTPMPGKPVESVFHHLLINGSPVSISEDTGFWSTLCTLAKNRPRPDASWDTMGTLEFQLKLPELWCRQKAATMIQRVSLGYLGRRAAKLMQDEHMTEIQSSSAAMAVAGLLAGGRRKGGVSSGQHGKRH